jgi:hypothetical protein
VNKNVELSFEDVNMIYNIFTYLRDCGSYDSSYWKDNVKDSSNKLIEKMEKVKRLEEEDNEEHSYHPKPPLGVMPRDIYELQRVQELTRALYDYSRYEELDLELMLKWADELDDRLFNLTQED